MRSGEAFLAAITAVSVLGSTACSNTTEWPEPVSPAGISTGCPIEPGVSSVRLIGSSNDGGENAVNGGECVSVYEYARPDSPTAPGQRIVRGFLPKEGNMVIRCASTVTAKDLAFFVDVVGQEGLPNVIGYILMDGDAEKLWRSGKMPQVGICPGM